MATPELELADWRRQVSRLYAQVRAEPDPAEGHARWRAGRDELLRTHPQSPLPAGDPLRETGLPYWPYDPAWRFELDLVGAPEPARLQLPTGSSTTTLDLIGLVELPAPFEVSLAVWWMDQYAGGIFVPVRDGSAGRTSYGGGRYALDTAKSADLGGDEHRLVLDLNFLYHPSCRYDPEWVCPLAPAGNTIALEVNAGERLSF